MAKQQLIQGQKSYLGEAYFYHMSSGSLCETSDHNQLTVIHAQVYHLYVLFSIAFSFLHAPKKKQELSHYCTDKYTCTGKALSGYGSQRVDGTCDIHFLHLSSLLIYFLLLSQKRKNKKQKGTGVHIYD